MLLTIFMAAMRYQRMLALVHFLQSLPELKVPANDVVQVQDSFSITLSWFNGRLCPIVAAWDVIVNVGFIGPHL
jgi:hypothetical protein